MQRQLQGAFSQPLEVESSSRSGKNKGVKALFLTLAGSEAFDSSGSPKLTESEETLIMGVRQRNLRHVGKPWEKVKHLKDMV